MSLGIIIAIVASVLTALTALIAWEQLRQTPKKHSHSNSTPHANGQTSKKTPTKLLPHLEHPGQPLANWVGRKQEMDELSTWLTSDDRHSICCLEGIMG